jgi:hypothetical protein
MIINLTQHEARPEQIAAGVYDLEGEHLARLRELLTFEDLPAPREIAARAKAITDLATASAGYPVPALAMIGGAPFLMGALECALRLRGIEPRYAFSKRESVEEIVRDAEHPFGIVRKTQVFRHLGFVTPP